MKNMIYFFLWILLICIPDSAFAVDKSSAGAEVVVTYLEGSARVFTSGKTGGRTIKKGDSVGKQDEIRLGERSRAELRFPDGTVMRLAENSRLAMSEINYDARTEAKKMDMNLGIGKIWAKVRKLMTPDSAVQVRTGNAVAGVRGTVYRINVEADGSATVKVYDGSVSVGSPPKDQTVAASPQFTAPVPVPGPHEVPPPMHEVTMEEWHVIVKAMQEVSISSSGVASQPRDFDPKADADEWVRWNQERDKKLDF